LANTRIRKWRVGRSAATDGIDRVPSTGIDVRGPGFELTTRSIAVADATGLSGYDSACPALALTAGAGRITEDRRLAAAGHAARSMTTSLASF
jgi:predicted nucleic acid-binding protein